MKPPRIRRPRSRIPDPASVPDEPPAEQPVDPDWFERPYTDPDSAHAQEQPRIPWWRPYKTDAPAEEPAGEPLHPTPGVNIYITPPPAPQAAPDPNPARAKLRRWLAVHGALAGFGWVIGLGPAFADLYVKSGNSAPAVGAAMVLICYLFGAYLPGLPYVPAQLRPLVIALCRFPACTAVLALALHAPNALI